MTVTLILFSVAIWLDYYHPLTLSVALFLKGKKKEAFLIKHDKSQITNSA